MPRKEAPQTQEPETAEEKIFLLESIIKVKYLSDMTEGKCEISTLSERIKEIEERVKTDLIKDYFPKARSSPYYLEACLYRNDICRAVENAVRLKYQQEDPASAYAKANGEWAANVYLEYIKTKQMPDMDAEDVNPEVEKKPDFGSASDWICFCLAVCVYEKTHDASYLVRIYKKLGIGQKQNTAKKEEDDKKEESAEQAPHD